MHVEIFSLCDAATQQGGKLNILGAIDSIFTRKLPASIPQCALALRVRFGLSEQGIHKVTVRFINSDGKNLVKPINGELNIRFPEGQTSLSQNLILNIQRLSIQKTGEYAIHLLIDNQQMATLPLFVRTATPPE